MNIPTHDTSIRHICDKCTSIVPAVTSKDEYIWHCADCRDWGEKYIKSTSTKSGLILNKLNTINYSKSSRAFSDLPVSCFMNKYL